MEPPESGSVLFKIIKRYYFLIGKLQQTLMNLVLHSAVCSGQNAQNLTYNRSSAMKIITGVYKQDPR